jgi:hypothetical protein
MWATCLREQIVRLYHYTIGHIRPLNNPMVELKPHSYNHYSGGGLRNNICPYCITLGRMYIHLDSSGSPDYIDKLLYGDTD